MRIEPVTSLDDPRLAWYRGVSDPALLREGQRFVAEGRTVVARLLADGRWDVESLLVSPAALRALEASLPAGREDGPLVFVAEPDRLVGLAGFNIHRGCLAIARRRALPAADVLVPAAGRRAWLLGLEGLANADNVGGCFRNAVAFGVDAVILDTGCADPLYRKAIRTSAAATLQVPFARVASWPPFLEHLRHSGVVTVALTPGPDAAPLASLPAGPRDAARTLLLVGNEGSGLSPSTLAACDHRLRIEMATGVDSLNVATAAGIALHALWPELRQRRRGVLPA